MPRGRHSQPDAVNEAKGNPGRRKRKGLALAAEAQPFPGGPPKDLSEEAQKIWVKLFVELNNLSFIRETDHTAFARYCQYLAEWWACVKEIKENGSHYVTESLHGTMRRLSPAFLVRERLEKHLISHEDRFGLNPVYRQQLLQRMAGMTPQPPPGGLFQPPESPDEIQPAEESAGSPIGLLQGASSATH